MKSKIYHISTPFEKENTGDYDYGTSLVDALNSTGQDAVYLNAGNVGYKEQFQSIAEAVEKLNLKRGKKEEFEKELENLKDNKDRQAVIKQIKEYIMADSKGCIPILNLQLRPPETGFAFMPDDIDAFKKEEIKVNVTCHEYELNYTREHLQDVLHHYFTKADTITFFNEQDLQSAETKSGLKLRSKSILSRVPPTVAYEMPTQQEFLSRPKNLIAFGLIRENKGFEEALDIAANIKEEDDMRMIIAGFPASDRLLSKILQSKFNLEGIKHIMLDGLKNEKLSEEDKKLFSSLKKKSETINPTVKDKEFAKRHSSKLNSAQILELENKIANVKEFYKKTDKIQGIIVNGIIGKIKQPKEPIPEINRNLLEALDVEDQDMEESNKVLDDLIIKNSSNILDKLVSEIKKEGIPKLRDFIKKYSEKKYESQPIDLALDIPKDEMPDLFKNARYAVKFDNKGWANNASGHIAALANGCIVYTGWGMDTSKEVTNKNGKHYGAIPFLSGQYSLKEGGKLSELQIEKGGKGDHYVLNNRNEGKNENSNKDYVTANKILNHIRAQEASLDKGIYMFARSQNLFEEFQPKKVALDFQKQLLPIIYKDQYKIPKISKEQQEIIDSLEFDSKEPKKIVQSIRTLQKVFKNKGLENPLKDILFKSSVGGIEEWEINSDIEPQQFITLLDAFKVNTAKVTITNTESLPRTNYVKGFYSNQDVETLLEGILNKNEKTQKHSYKNQGDYIKPKDNKYILKCSSLSDKDSIEDRQQVISNILKTEENCDILIPVKQANSDHWITAQLKFKNGKLENCKTYNSLGKEGDKFVENLVQKFDKSIDVNAIDINPIQKDAGNVYCGGYTAHLIANLALNNIDDMNFSDNKVWNIDYQNDLMQRENDAIIVKNYNPDREKEFALVNMDQELIDRSAESNIKRLFVLNQLQRKAPKISKEQQEIIDSLEFDSKEPKKIVQSIRTLQKVFKNKGLENPLKDILFKSSVGDIEEWKINSDIEPQQFITLLDAFKGMKTSQQLIEKNQQSNGYTLNNIVKKIGITLAVGTSIYLVSKLFFSSSNNLRRSEKEDLIETTGIENYNFKDELLKANSKEQQNIINKLQINVSEPKIASLESKRDGNIIFMPEDNHITKHKNNTEKLMTQIKSRSKEDNEREVIFLERKEEGNNFGMKDVRLLVNIIKYNETNSKKIVIPEELKTSPIYQDAQLYNVAIENGVKVIGAEGKGLKYSKESSQYNQEREKYMATKIQEMLDKGYNITMPVGANHIKNLEQAFSEIDNVKEISGSSKKQDIVGKFTAKVLDEEKKEHRLTR